MSSSFGLESFASLAPTSPAIGTWLSKLWRWPSSSSSSSPSSSYSGSIVSWVYSGCILSAYVDSWVKGASAYVIFAVDALIFSPAAFSSNNTALSPSWLLPCASSSIAAGSSSTASSSWPSSTSSPSSICSSSSLSYSSLYFWVSDIVMELDVYIYLLWCMGDVSMCHEWPHQNRDGWKTHINTTKKSCHIWEPSLSTQPWSTYLAETCWWTHNDGEISCQLQKYQYL